MPFKPTTIRTFIFAISIYFIGLTTCLYLQQESAHNNQLEKTDIELLLAISKVRTDIFDKSTFDVSGNTSISPRQSVEITEKLTAIVKKQKLDHIYTVVLRDKTAFVTSSSQTEKEPYKYSFLSDYPEASDTLIEVFKTGEPNFDEYSNQNGDFRAFFQPIFKGNKIDYIIATDISTKKIKQSIQESFYASLGLGLFLSLIVLPLIWLFARSITKERNAEKNILFINPETGLNNLTKLHNDTRNRENLNLAIIEVENFNNILNAIGPAKTHHVTKQMITRIYSFIERGSYDVQLYYVSPSKFAVLSPSGLSTNTEIIKRLFKELVKTGYGVLPNNDIHLSIYIGVAINEQSMLTLDDPNEQSLFILANIALKKAIEENKSIVLFNDTSDLPQTYLDNIQQTNIFHRALYDGRLRAFFQPIVDAKTSQIVKFECLARVIDDSGNVIQNPEEFMPIAYAYRLGHKVTRLMLDQSIEAINGKEYCISINLSVSDLFDHATMDYICYQLDKSKHPEQIEFEILEHEDIQDYSKAAGLILRLKRRGCRVGMDDLGKHYSNFDRLTNLPLDFVKIDGGIIPYILDDGTTLTVAKNIIHLAKNMQLDIIAEYCINEKVYDAAVSLGIDYLQGFFIGMPNPDIQELIQNHNKIKPKLIPFCPVLETTKVVKPEYSTFGH